VCPRRLFAKPRRFDLGLIDFIERRVRIFALFMAKNASIMVTIILMSDF